MAEMPLSGHTHLDTHTNGRTTQKHNATIAKGLGGAGINMVHVKVITKQKWHSFRKTSSITS